MKQKHEAMADLELAGYIIRDGTVILVDAGKRTTIGIRELVNRDDLIDRLPPQDALRIGSWHESHRRQNHGMR